jgi:hypothetical protein
MVNITTALFDIKRDIRGDGRSINQYLDWFDTTLSLECNMTIYTEPKFLDFIESRRSNESTKTICCDLENIPYYYLLNGIEKILGDSEYLNKIKDPNRIECKLPMYNIIQYSKFKWIKKSIELDDKKSDFYFWMDAGCSRFFGNNPINNWPDSSKIERGKLNIQGNINTQNIYGDLEPNIYKWDNNCILVGTLFGGDPETMEIIEGEIEKILINEMIGEGMVNNEQIALGILYKRNPDLFSVHLDPYSGHLPFFGHLSNVK